MASYPMLKVMLLGDGNVGKTSLARRYCEGKFENSRILTIGVDFQTKVVELPSGAVKLSIWDVAGQPRFQIVRETFYRGCSSAALVCDVTDGETMQHLGAWLKELQQFAIRSKFIVVANKKDLAGERPIPPEAQAFAEEHGVPFVTTSAATGEGVADMFRELARSAFSNC
jgi:small GTP-binding protein